LQLEKTTWLFLLKVWFKKDRYYSGGDFLFLNE